jgi:hypothetical protein
MTVIPIPLSGRNPIEYIPTPQDVERYERTERERLKREHDAAGRIEDETARTERYRQIDAEADQVLENAATMRRLYPSPQRFILSVPTATDREQINSRLISLGLSQVTQEQIRATLIEELYYQDWGKGSDEANEAEADEIANFLDGCWQRVDAHNMALERWQEQEIERVLDEAAGAPSRERAEQPPKIITVRENARMQRVIERMMADSQAMRDMAAKRNDYQRRNALLLARIHVIDASNVGGLTLERDPRTRTLSEETVLALREQVDDASWGDLITTIDQMYRLEETERKNSVSPPASSSTPGGSSEPSADTSASGGSSTSSNTDPAPSGASERITGKSSGSGLAPDTEQANGKALLSPMGEA